MSKSFVFTRQVAAPTGVEAAVDLLQNQPNLTVTDRTKWMVRVEGPEAEVEAVAPALDGWTVTPEQYGTIPVPDSGKVPTP